MPQNRYLLFFNFIICLLIVACKQQEHQSATQNNGLVFHEKLSDYGFFEGDLALLKPTKGVEPYELNTPLFSDYSQKARFIKLPLASKIKVTGDELDFPKGTILIKNFYYFHNDQTPEKGRRLIETRLLVRQEKKWEVANYEWNDEQTEAVRNILGGSKLVEWIDAKGITKKIKYVIPDNNDCKSCHKKNGYVNPIGPKIKNLNTTKVYNGKEYNQLLKWQQKGLIENLPALKQLTKLAKWDDPHHFDLESRARAYLDVNCAHCHSVDGPASNTGLFLDYEEHADNRIGIMKGPVSAAQGSGELKYNIVPGHAKASILYYRMNSAETGIAMPEIGKTIVHEEGVQLIAEWINNMEE